ncbi:MlaD family protein [Caenimonas aquaedulcis]|uniref:MCE family protein n=1 Tax=Caenimonas aquaedulcis TaxID=2793270 RepID=A0A931H543_9BURK|nr:MlaD family protein [Caenimonas aquaedulcis]MBG9388751.1 MCE family protein [Caenimonas aquaedulcis]
MENKAHALAAGIFVVVVAAMLVALASWLTRDTGERDPYEISTRETVTGLQAQAAVRYRGVDVGKVAAIGFDPKAQGNVLMHLEIDREAPVSTDTFATLSFQGVTGLAFVQLDDTGQANAPRLKPQDGHPPRIPLKPGLLSKLQAKGEVILDRVEQLTGRMNQLLGDDNQKRFSSALDNLNNAAGDASKLAQRLDATVASRVDPALQSVQKSADQIGQTAADFSQTAKRLNAKDGPMDRLAEGTQALSHAADSFNSATLPRINRVAEDASRAVRQLGRTANNINDNPQSLIFGGGPVAPGPGEPGFTAPGAGK